LTWRAPSFTQNTPGGSLVLFRLFGPTWPLLKLACSAEPGPGQRHGGRGGSSSTPLERCLQGAIRQGLARVNASIHRSYQALAKAVASCAINSFFTTHSVLVFMVYFIWLHLFQFHIFFLKHLFVISMDFIVLCWFSNLSSSAIYSYTSNPMQLCWSDLTITSIAPGPIALSVPQGTIFEGETAPFGRWFAIVETIVLPSFFCQIFTSVGSSTDCISMFFYIPSF